MVEIREAVRGDASALHDHLTAVFAESPPGIFVRPQPPSIARVIENIGRCASSPNSILLVALAEGQVIGTLDFYGHERPQQRHGGYFGMSVRRGHRGNGVGTALIEGLVSWAPSHGVTRLELGVFATNPGAIRLYERLGFEHEGRLVGAVMVHGNPVDILLMARRLST